MSNIFDQMLSRYEIQTKDDYTNALHEVMQQIALAGLYRGGFSIRLHFTEALVFAFSTNCSDFQKIWIFLCYSPMYILN